MPRGAGPDAHRHGVSARCRSQHPGLPEQARTLLRFQLGIELTETRLCHCSGLPARGAKVAEAQR